MASTTSLAVTVGTMWGWVIRTRDRPAIRAASTNGASATGEALFRPNRMTVPAASTPRGTISTTVVTTVPHTTIGVPKGKRVSTSRPGCPSPAGGEGPDRVPGQQAMVERTMRDHAGPCGRPTGRKTGGEDDERRPTGSVSRIGAPPPTP